MSFNLNKLAVTAYGNGFTHWHYKPDLSESVPSLLERGYFDHAASSVKSGDAITISNEYYAASGFAFVRGRDVAFVPACPFVFYPEKWRV